MSDRLARRWRSVSLRWRVALAFGLVTTAVAGLLSLATWQLASSSMRRTLALLVELGATSAVSCGVEPQHAGPLPATTPVVVPPSVTQEPAPTPRPTSTVAPTP